jgi:arylamine N-acetyltransferase
VTGVLPVDEILESLDLSRAEPGLGYLEALFTRFNARVPFENATKILRHAAVADPAEKPRRPGLFWRDHLSSGTGGTCFARVEAFYELLVALDFRVVRALGKVGADFDHAALFVERDGRRFLCDVGFPLPAVVPAATGHHATASGTLDITETARGLAVAFAEGVPEGSRAIEVFTGPVAPQEFESHWRATFRPGAHFLSSVRLRVEREGRTLAFSEGAARVDDLHSRLTVPLASPRARRLSELFAMEEEILEKALRLVGDPEPEAGGGSLTAYLETPVTPEEAFASIGTPEGYRELLAGLGAVSVHAEAPDAFRLRVSAGESFIEEDVTADRAARRLSVLRRGPSGTAARFAYRTESRGGATYLIREALFETPRDDLLRHDALRGRLAGSLAVDLLAWSRRIVR